MSADPFDHILNWRLLAGSHAFPGPDGGTCINEAAIVAAGLPYKAVKGSEDCPPCFSRPLASYALGLNDAMPDEARPRLLRFVLRLSGSADSESIEAARIAFLAIETVRRVLPPILDRAGFPLLAARCEAVPDGQAARLAARVAQSRGGALAHRAAGNRDWVAGARAAAVARCGTAACKAFDDPRCAAEVAEGAASFVTGIWPVAVGILDEALRIGRQAPGIDLVEARGRLDAARGASRVALDTRAV